jgi:hypothetical protein
MWLGVKEHMWAALYQNLGVQRLQNNTCLGVMERMWAALYQDIGVQKP